MSSWPEVPLGSVLTHGDPTYGIVQPGKHVESGVPIIRVSDMDGNVVSPAEPLRVSREIESQYQRTRLKGGEVLVSIVGTVGRVATVPADLADWNVARAVAVLRPKDSSDREWVRYALINPSAQVQMQIRKTDTVQATLNLRDLRAISIPWPHVAIRERIAGVLGAFDDLIDTNRQFASHVRDLSATLYSVLAEGGGAEIALGEVAAINPGKVRPGTGSIRYIDIASMGDGSIDIPDAIDWANAPSRARVAARPGATLWSTVRPNRRAHGLLVEAPPDLVVSTGVAVLSPTGIGPAELFAAADRGDFVDQLVAMADGSAYPAVRPGAFADVTIPFLDMEVSAQFERVMWPLWQDVHAGLEENRRLSRARDELLPLLMSGRVRVREGVA